MAKGKKKTHDEFVEEVIKMRGDIYDFLTTYENQKIRIKIRHRECGHIWDAIPFKIIDKNKKGVYCQNCNVKNKQLTHEQFVKKVKDCRGDSYEFLTCYISYEERITVKHKECGYIWSPFPSQLVRKSHNKIVCPNCNWGSSHTLEIFKQNVYELVGEEYIVLGDYINATTKIKIKHNIDTCIHEYYIEPNSFIRKGSRCPKCGESKGEKRVRRWLEDNDVHFIPQKKFDNLFGIGGGNLSYDFYIPEQNTLIEYQGEFHDGSGDDFTKLNLERQQEHDRRKREYTQQNNIELLEIWYWDYDNVESILNKLILHKIE